MVNCRGSLRLKRITPIPFGVCVPVCVSKLTAHTLCIYINRLLGKPDFLQIKTSGFPELAYDPNNKNINQQIA